VRIALAISAVVVALWASGGALAQQPRSTSPAARHARAAELRRLGEAYIAAGDRSSALAYFREAITVDPDDAAAYVALGDVYLARGSTRDALEVYSAGLRRRPDDVPLWRAKADALVALSAFGEAARALRECIARAPDDPECTLASAQVARRRGAWSEALAAYRALLDASARHAGDIPPASITEARHFVPALSVLVGRTDPVRGVQCAPARSSVRRALARCTGG